MKISSKMALLTALALAGGHGGGISYSGVYPNMHRRCNNCGKPTFSSEFCDLRCVCAYKAKQREKGNKSEE